jgi:hypothetical protein
VADVICPFLTAVGARWDDGPEAGRWIVDRLAAFGPTVGRAVPLGYEAYAVVPVQWDQHEDDDDYGPLSVVELVLDALEPFTNGQFVHCAMWDGWSWWYPTGADPRVNASVGVFWSDEERPSQEWIDRTRAEGVESVAAHSVEEPNAERLDLTERKYYLWTGPLASAMAIGHEPQNPPSLIWPDDRSWFVGAPEYTREIAVAGTDSMITALLADSRRGARRASSEDVLDIDD